jgi:hypothetical protein
MKKVYLMAVAALFGSASMAQVSVTFQVDMNGTTVSANGVHVAGNWQDEAGFSAEWQPGESMLTDGDADGIYELTVDVPPGEYEFKFVNGNNWDPDGTNLGNEGVPNISRKGGGNNNRVFVVSQWHADNGGLVLPANTYDGSAPAGQVALRFEVDMDDAVIDEDGIHVAGDFSNPQFNPAVSKMWSYAEGQYAFVANVDENSTATYIYTNGDTYAGVEWEGENPPAECTDGSSRTADVTADDVNTGLVCFEQCGACSQPTMVTFRVNTSLLSEVSTYGMHVAGNWQAAAGLASDWTPGNSAMTDLGGGIWEYVAMVPPGSYQYKFVNGNAFGPDDPLNFGDESIPGECNVGGNRGFDPVEGEALVLENCYNQCTEQCISDPDPAAITFLVDMSEEPSVSETGVYLIGSFTNFQSGALEMTDDDADNIYEVTTIIEGPADIAFKFTNGDPFPGGVIDATVEETHDFATDGCGIANGIGGFNRTHTRSGEAEDLGFVYNSCMSILSTTDLELGRVAVYPNPSEGASFLEVENPNNHTLRMNIVDITGKVVTDNMLINTTRYEINTTNLNSGLYFLNIVNERSERAVYKLMVQ